MFTAKHGDQAGHDLCLHILSICRRGTFALALRQQWVRRCNCLLRAPLCTSNNCASSKQSRVELRLGALPVRLNTSCLQCAEHCDCATSYQKKGAQNTRRCFTVSGYAFFTVNLDRSLCICEYIRSLVPPCIFFSHRQSITPDQQFSVFLVLFPHTSSFMYPRASDALDSHLDFTSPTHATAPPI